MSEEDQKMKGRLETETETETETCSSVVKNDDKQNQILIHNNNKNKNKTGRECNAAGGVMNLGLSLGGLYGKSSGQKHDQSSRSSSPCNTGGIQNVVVVGDQEAAAPPVISCSIDSASRSRALCRAIHQIRRDNTLFQFKGPEVLPERRVFRPQLVPIRRRLARSSRMMQATSIAYAKAAAQRKLHNIMANATPSNIGTRLVAHQNRYLSPIGAMSYGFQVPDRRYHQCPLLASAPSYGRPAAEMIMFQDILGPVPNYKRPLAASNSYARPYAGMNHVEYSAGITFQNGPALAGPIVEFAPTKLFHSASGSGSNGTMFRNAAAGFDSNNGTNNIQQNNEPRGTQNNQPIQQQQPQQQASGGSSGSTTKPVEHFAVGQNNPADGGSGSGSSQEGSDCNAADEDEDSDELSNPPKRVKLSINEGLGSDLDVKLLRKMPIVIARGETHVVEGFLYKYKKGEIIMMCNCHGYFLNPTQFLQHAGVTDLSAPLKSITVIPFQI